jgi:16S rRNA (cytosine967-C5)-methyltransferase
VTTARAAAARALLAIQARESTLGAALDVATVATADAREAGLTVELTTGVLRWQRELDALIAGAAQRATRTIDPTALVVLRLGAYQLRHLDRIPPHAVVSTSVDAVRELGAPRAAGFVNAVLRSMIRRGPALALPKRPTGPDPSRQAQVAYLSITLSHPAWLVERWLDRLGFDVTEAWCRFNNTSPSVTVRARRSEPVAGLAAELVAAGIDAVPAPFVEDALRLPAGALGKVPEALRQRIWIQDEGAQLVARAAGVQPGERVLDLCAAPGGKSIVMAGDLAREPLDAPGLLVASDFRPSRVALLARVLSGSGVSAPVVRLDARSPLPFAPLFDCVLADVPCSGLGTLRREPDLKWSRTAADLRGLADEELRILRAAADAVRPGGRLLYATCSSEPDENEEVVRAFLAADSRFIERPVGPPIPAALLDDHGHLHTRPDRHGLEVFFGAMLVRLPGT